MAKHATLLGHHGHGHPGQQILHYFLAHCPDVHFSSPHLWVLRFLDSHGFCAFLCQIDPCYANHADDKQKSPQKLTSTEVWTQFNNGGDWPTQALSVFVGLIGSVFANNGKIPSRTRVTNPD